MDSHGSRGTDFYTRRETTWAALEGYGYLAPSRVAMDEQRERVMTEAAHRRLCASPDPAGRHSRWQNPCRFLGNLLEIIPGRIRQIHACGAVIATLRRSTAD
jgi:hypothetical protein